MFTSTFILLNSVFSYRLQGFIYCVFFVELWDMKGLIMTVGILES